MQTYVPWQNYQTYVCSCNVYRNDLRPTRRAYQSGKRLAGCVEAKRHRHVRQTPGKKWKHTNQQILLCDVYAISMQ